jgi:cytochrome P450
VTYCELLVEAGNETTRNAISGAFLAFCEHPGEWEKLRAQPALVTDAVEEILRWVSPISHFTRVATEDCVGRDRRVRAGDQVALYFASANRDEDVFDDSQRFDIRRNPNPHLSFGIAEHFCLGVHLARLEGRVFFEELLATFPTIEITGEPRRTRSNLNNSLKALPVRLSTS